MNSHGMTLPSFSSSDAHNKPSLSKEESESSSAVGESVGNQRKCALSFLIRHFQSRHPFPNAMFIHPISLFYKKKKKEKECFLFFIQSS
ncbi:hypothetical protein CEXT_28031 [Caerostris extrusa]|uniref:Uncharacterized protein n=1 Tax=Caerostris extrusa TaxID=172846 RepID=A0AAV4NCT9_CAEEX|nr:hypothetical protein CEXT_28031 [Caerostris extrusa]